MLADHWHLHNSSALHRWHARPLRHPARGARHGRPGRQALAPGCTGDCPPGWRCALARQPPHGVRWPITCGRAAAALRCSATWGFGAGRNGDVFLFFATDGQGHGFVGSPRLDRLRTHRHCLGVMGPDAAGAAAAMGAAAFFSGSAAWAAGAWAGSAARAGAPAKKANANKVTAKGGVK